MVVVVLYVVGLGVLSCPCVVVVYSVLYVRAL